MESEIIKLNTLNKRPNGVWASGTTDFKYSDGAHIESYLRAVLQNAEDVSCKSHYLEKFIKNWETEYHLSSLRSALLQFVSLGEIVNVLELGCGCGAITRYLGEMGLAVDAVEGSAQRAELARMRCKDLEKVTIVHSNFNDLKFPDNYYDAVIMIGCLEYSKRFFLDAADSEDAVGRILTQSIDSLKDDGLIIIAIENRMGLKYWMGASEDHYGISYLGLEGYSPTAGIQTFDKKSWQKILAESGIKYHRFAYPFPDYKLPTVIMSDQFIQKDRYAYSLLNRVHSKDYHREWKKPWNEFLGWKSLHQAGYFEDFANSFLLLASKSKERLEDSIPNDFMVFSYQGRKQIYRTVTIKPKQVDTIVKKNLFAELSESNNEFIRQHVFRSAYISGELLSTHWLEALHLSGDDSEFLKHLFKYYQYLMDYSQKIENPATLYDLIPSNIIVDQEGNYHAIDLEWSVNTTFNPEFVFFRALFWFADLNHNSLAAFCRKRSIGTVNDFIKFCFEYCAQVKNPEISRFVALEEAVGKEVSIEGPLDYIRYVLGKSFEDNSRSSEINHFISQLFWKSKRKPFSDADSLTTAGIFGRQQHLVFELPALDGPMPYLRFDPASCPCIIEIHEISIYNPGANVSYWQAKQKHQLRKLKIGGTARKLPHATHLRIVSWGDDPQLYLPPIKNPGIQGSIKVEIIIMIQKRNEASPDLIEKFKPGLLFYILGKRNYSRFILAMILMKDGMKSLKDNGVTKTLNKTVNYLKSKKIHRIILGGNEYKAWIKKYEKPDLDISAIRRNIQRFRYSPKISLIMPVYNIDEIWLKEAISSVIDQIYENWELCIVDDASTKSHIRETIQNYVNNIGKIKAKFLDDNRGIAGASNEAISMTTGTFIGFIDHDDKLSPVALYEVVKKLNENENLDLIYSDEDKIDENNRRKTPFFKPDWSPDTFRSYNYICHFTVIRKKVVESIGGFRQGFEGAQDYDLFLRVIDHTQKIAHIPKILYHWRTLETSAARYLDAKPYAFESTRKALLEHLSRNKLVGDVKLGPLMASYRIKYAITEKPEIKIIIPSKDKSDVLKTCIDSIMQKSTYPKYSILIIDNNSSENKTFQYYQTLDAYPNTSILIYDKPFNFSAIQNWAVKQIKTENVILLNNDIEIISPDWIESMLEFGQRGDVGVVGSILYYPNNTIQHGGVIIGIGGVAGHSHKYQARDSLGYFSRLKIIQNLSAVTAACMLTKKSIFEEVGGFDENLTHAFNDVDYCIKVRQKGYLIVYTPYAELYHHESISRGYEDTKAKRQRFMKEIAYVKNKWNSILDKGDPYYNPNLTREKEDFSLKM